MTGQSGGWFGSTADAMRIDPTFWPTCEWNVFAASAPEEQPSCHNPAVWILTYEHEFRVVLCDEHLAERPTPNNKLLVTERIEEWRKTSTWTPSAG
jgi:hypothetical protein